MTALLSQLWFATVYVAVVVTVVLVRNNRRRGEAYADDEGYVGRHRPGCAVPDYEPFDWQADFEHRIAAILAEKKAAKAALKEPTQELLVAPVDSKVGPYVHHGGSAGYVHLRDAEMDAAADWAALLAEKGLRHPWPTPADVDVWEEELIGVAT
jgi:hypothetical protein